MVQANSDTLETVDLSGKVNKNWAKKEVGEKITSHIISKQKQQLT
jgi:hypothetical protein